MDIMATLHHGLLVDPTNSKQIADALLKILTNPEVWDEMSHNGAPPPEPPLDILNRLISVSCLLTVPQSGVCLAWACLTELVGCFEVLFELCLCVG